MKRVLVTWLVIGAWLAGGVMATQQNRCGIDVARKMMPPSTYWSMVLGWPVFLVSAISWRLGVDELPKPDCRVN